MARALPKKIREYYRNESLQTQFRDLARHAHLPDLLWPERNPRAFPAAFRVTEKRAQVVFPLVEVNERLDYVALHIEHLTRSMASHPAVAFLYLSLFQEDYKKSGQRYPANRKRIYDRVQKFKRRLVVSPAVRRARDRRELAAAVLAELNQVSLEFFKQREYARSLEIELEMHRKALGYHAEDRKRLEELAAENANVTVMLAREHERARTLETELTRLAEQVLSGGGLPNESEIAEEYRALRNEFNILSQKYDALVSNNIELSNRLERANKTRALEEILNSVRDKINGVLRSGLIQNDEALIAAIHHEITQLQRARIYLGRALYDVGMLYFRSGDRKRALSELRAARELGVEYAESNRIIGTLT